jgi:hypothetical protein
VEQGVGVAVDLVARGRGEAEQEAVEVLEEDAVALVDRAVGLVDDHEVEAAGAVEALAADGALEAADHRRVGRDDDRRALVLGRGEVDDGVVGEVLAELGDGLADEGDAVAQEQHAAGPTCPLEQVDQGGGGAGLAGAGRHDEQGAALVVALEPLGDGAQGPDLVLAAGDLRVGLEVGQRALRAAAGDQRLDLRGRVELGDGARRVAAGVVPQEDLVAVGVEDDRAAAVLALERVGVALGLVLAALGVGAGLLGLDDGERAAVDRPEHVVGDCRCCRRRA